MTPKSKLIKKIQALDFAIYEMVLYLDTHPNCPQGLRLLAQYRAERNAAVAEYEKAYGKPLVYTFEEDDIAGWMGSEVQKHTA